MCSQCPSSVVVLSCQSYRSRHHQRIPRQLELLVVVKLLLCAIPEIEYCTCMHACRSLHRCTQGVAPKAAAIVMATWCPSLRFLDLFPYDAIASKGIWTALYNNQMIRLRDTICRNFLTKQWNLLEKSGTCTASFGDDVPEVSMHFHQFRYSSPQCPIIVTRSCI